MKTKIVYIKIPIVIKINNVQNIRKYINKLFKKDVFVEDTYTRKLSNNDMICALFEQRNIIKTIEEINNGSL